MPCSNCDKNLPIVNKKYELCNNCNSIRLTGKSLVERQVESSSKYREKYVTNFRNKVTRETTNLVTNNRKPIRRQTAKESVVKSQLSNLKKDIELEAVQNNEYYCKGCGVSHVGLDKSHILSVGQFKALELIKNNIQLLCRSCHSIWESGTIEQQMKLNCFIDNLHFIYTQDQVSYRKFITRIEEYKAWLIDGKDQGKIKAINEILNQLQVD